MRSETTGSHSGTAWRAGIQYDPGRTQYMLNYTSLGDTFRDALLAKGGSADSMEVYRAFRGRDPLIEPLLKRRGLITVP